MIEARGLVCGYGGPPVLNGVDLSVQPGEIVILLGPNGSGKTTLMRAMGRLLRPIRGSVLLDGRDIWATSPRRVARSVGWVSQNGRLAWPFTVQQVVSLGRFPHRGWIASYTTEDRRVVDEAIRATGLTEHRERAIDTLSGGEAQRAMLARVLAQKPRVMLLDEPVAHLDMKYQISVLDLVRDLAGQGIAAVISLHDPNLAALYADRVVLLSAGRIFASGEPAAILVRENLEAVYETRVIVGRHPANHRPLITPIPSWMSSPDAR